VVAVVVGVAVVVVVGVAVVVVVVVGVAVAVVVAVVVGVVVAVVVAVGVKLWRLIMQISMREGECYYVRTLSDHWVGRCIGIGPDTVLLEEAAWVADSGRLSVFLAKGEAPNMEIEVVGTVCVRWYAWLPWPHKLFTKTK
jgi:hypothetical protein